MLRDLENPIERQVSVTAGAELSGTTVVTASWVDCEKAIGPVCAVVNLGAATGTPDAQNHAVKIQEADEDDGTGSQDLSGATGSLKANGALLVIQAKNRTKRYVKIHITPAFTGGTTPKNVACGVIEFQKESY